MKGLIKIRDLLQAVFRDNQGVFDADRAHLGEYELGFKSKHHARCQGHIQIFGDHRQFVKLDSHPVPDKAHPVLITHEIVFQA